MADAGRRAPVAIAARVTQSVDALLDALAERLGALGDPRGEARELLAALLDVPRHWSSLHGNKWMDGDVWRRACAAADKRASGAPLAYAVGKATFRSLTLAVDERVLIPRPETELLVDLVLRVRNGGVAVDVGTGSGAIAIALATEGRFDRVVGVDVSTDALDVARHNAVHLGAAVTFHAGDLLRDAAAHDAGGFDVIVSNPPYISFDDISALPASVRDWEPAVALLSGRDGLDATARLVRQASRHLLPGGLLALEVDVRRASLVVELLAAAGCYTDVSVQLDLTGRERFVLALRREQE